MPGRPIGAVQDAQQAQAVVEARQAEVTHWERCTAPIGTTWRPSRSSLHPCRLADSTPQTSARGRKPVARRARGDRSVARNASVAGPTEGPEQGPQAARRPCRPWSTSGGRGSGRIWQPSGPDAEVDGSGLKSAAAADVLAAPSVAHALPPTESQDATGIGGGARRRLTQHAITQQLAPEVLGGLASVGEPSRPRPFSGPRRPSKDATATLSQMHHNQRGLPKRRYKVWTVLHNFDCRAADGTTPASRFFRRAFPDLFETVLSQIDDLPRPRQRNQAIAPSH